MSWGSLGADWSNIPLNLHRLYPYFEELRRATYERALQVYECNVSAIPDIFKTEITALATDEIIKNLSYWTVDFDAAFGDIARLGVQGYTRWYDFNANFNDVPALSYMTLNYESNTLYGVYASKIQTVRGWLYSRYEDVNNMRWMRTNIASSSPYDITSYDGQDPTGGSGGTPPYTYLNAKSSFDADSGTNYTGAFGYSILYGRYTPPPDVPYGYRLTHQIYDYLIDPTLIASYTGVTFDYVNISQVVGGSFGVTNIQFFPDYAGNYPNEDYFYQTASGDSSELNVDNQIQFQSVPKTTPGDITGYEYLNLGMGFLPNVILKFDIASGFQFKNW